MGEAPRRSTLAIIEVTQMRPEAPDYQEFSSRLVGGAVERAIRGGWDVVRRPADIGTDALLEATAGVDAVLIMGGEDIAPERYGLRRGYANEGVHRPVADDAQLALVQRAAEQGTPLLGICRGHQIINVAFGGTLIPDLGDEHDHRVDDVPIERVLSEHTVLIEQGTELAAALGGVRVDVQSAHHQAVDDLGDGLAAIAWAEDGIIEAIAHESLPITGVQWHPEAPEARVEHFDALLDGLAAQVRASRLLAVA